MEHSTQLSPRKQWLQPEIILISQVNIEAKTRNFGQEATFVRSSAGGDPAHHFLTFQGAGHNTYVPTAVTILDFIS